MATRAPSQGVSAPIVTNIPDNWSAAWFRNFVINYLEPSDVRNAQAGTGIIIAPAATGLYKYPSTAIISTSGQTVLSQSRPIVAAGQIGLGNTTATTANTGTHGAPPAQVAGYLTINIGGTDFKVPYYAN